MHLFIAVYCPRDESFVKKLYLLLCEGSHEIESLIVILDSKSLF